MKFSILQQDLLPHLQAVGRSVGIRSTLPVLDNILLSVEGKKLKVAATNLEIGVIRSINVEVFEEGSITVPAKTLIELISGLGQSKVTVTTEGENLVVESNKFKASINCIPATEFPAIPLSTKDGIELSKEIVLSSSQILFAAAVDEGRTGLTGALTDVSGGKVDFVATDGFRLAHRRVKLQDKEIQPARNASQSEAGGFKCLIPRRTFEEVLRIISETEVDKIELAASSDQNQVVFNLGKTLLSSRLIEGQFPSWEKIIPTEIATRVMVDKEEFLKAVKLAAVFAKNETNIVVLTLEKSKLKIESSAKELGSQQNEIEANVEGDSLQIAFNSKFLSDAITSSPSLQIMIEFSGPLSAALIKPVGVEGLEYIVMPVRTN